MPADLPRRDGQRALPVPAVRGRHVDALRVRPLRQVHTISLLSRTCVRYPKHTEQANCHNLSGHLGPGSGDPGSADRTGPAPLRLDSRSHRRGDRTGPRPRDPALRPRFRHHRALHRAGRPLDSASRHSVRSFRKTATTPSYPCCHGQVHLRAPRGQRFEVHDTVTADRSGYRFFILFFRKSHLPHRLTDISRDWPWPPGCRYGHRVLEAGIADESSASVTSNLSWMQPTSLISTGCRPWTGHP